MSNGLVNVASDTSLSKMAECYTPAHSPCLGASTKCESGQRATAQDEGQLVFTRLQTQLYPTIRFF